MTSRIPEQLLLGGLADNSLNDRGHRKEQGWLGRSCRVINAVFTSFPASRSARFHAALMRASLVGATVAYPLALQWRPTVQSITLLEQRVYLGTAQMNPLTDLVGIRPDLLRNSRGLACGGEGAGIRLNR